MNKPQSTPPPMPQKRGFPTKKVVGVLAWLLAMVFGYMLFNTHYIAPSKAETKVQTASKAQAELQSKAPKGTTIISPARESISQTITTTGVVTPRNRLQIQPPVAGRLEQMLVKEGERVKAGQALATLSSTDRATLIDAAQSQGEEALKYWQEVYKPIQLVAPMDATVIVATLQPGQVVSTADAIVVLSDELIVQAQVDETDIGKVKVGQNATITLDSFPEEPVEAKVEHIYYESVVTSNVTVYKVDLNVSSDESETVDDDSVPTTSQPLSHGSLVEDPEPANRQVSSRRVSTATVPDFFRSGMNAQVAFEVQSRENALTLPSDALTVSKSGKSTVTILDAEGKTQPVEVATGLSANNKTEILSGLTEKSEVVVKSTKLNLNAASSGKNPFMPQFKAQKGGNNGGGGPRM